MIKSTLVTGVVLWMLIWIVPAWAHTPLMACFDNGDGTITCNGGFSDGSSAAGVAVRVVDEQESILLEGQMDEESEYTFDKPQGAFTVIFDAGPGHIIMEKSTTIVE